MAREPDSSPSVAFHRAAARRAVSFGPFRFDLSDKTLTREGEEVRLPPRALHILKRQPPRPSPTRQLQPLPLRKLNPMPGRACHRDT